MIRTLIFLLISFGFAACANKYRAFEPLYNFRSKDQKPDYTNLQYWAAHPWKWDPSDSVPEPLLGEPRDSVVDVFFLHPTTYTGRKPSKGMNAPIDDVHLNAKTDYSSILFQASVFNQQSRVFAPRYRQAHLSAFFNEGEKSDQAFALAYEDIKTAFEYYLKHFNQGRPIVIAAHSQGTKHANLLLSEFFDGKPLQSKLVVAYLIGWPVPKDLMEALPECIDSVQTGCICSWRTFRSGYIPNYIKKEKGKSLVTNPLTWSANIPYAPKSMNMGSVLRDFNSIYLNTTDARVADGVLWVSKPKFPGSILFTTRNYHIGDINLFYINIRDNLRTRISAYWKNKYLLN